MMEIAKQVIAVKIAPQNLTVLPNFGEVDIMHSIQQLQGVSGANERSSGLYIKGNTPD